MMNLQDCTKFANENPVCYFSTSDGDQPRVRAFQMWFADERGFYFGILSPKKVMKELQKNPKVEICFLNSKEPDKMKMLRVTGNIEFVNDRELTAKLAKERNFIEGIIGQPMEPITQVFRINKGEARFWTMMDNMKESGLERIFF
jgi:pyridoxamine 5'-phosphate oxidase